MKRPFSSRGRLLGVPIDIDTERCVKAHLSSSSHRMFNLIYFLLVFDHDFG